MTYFVLAIDVNENALTAQDTSVSSNHLSSGSRSLTVGPPVDTSPLPPYPHNRETCAGLFMLFLWHFHPALRHVAEEWGLEVKRRCDWRAEIDAVGAQTVSALTWQFAAGVRGSP